MAERVAVDPAVDELRRKARRRLVGAIVLALAAAVLLPMLLEKEPRPLGEDVAVRIPPVDDSKFVNRLSPGATKDVAPATAASGTMPSSDHASNAGRAAPTSPGATPADTAAVTPKAAPASEAAAAPSAASTAPTAEPAGGPVAKSDPTAKSDVSTAPESTTSPEATAKSDAATKAAATAKPAVTAKAEPRSSAETARDVRTETKTGEPAAKVASGFVVQLAAFSDDKGANSLASKLKRNGYPAFTEPIQTSRGTLYRVRVGSYASRDAALDARNKLKGDGYAGIVAPAH